jgi:hypothetical protein
MAFGDVLGSGTGASTNPGTTIAVSAGFTVAAGDLVVLTFGMRLDLPASVSVADGLSNTFTALTNADVGSATLSMWYCLITNAGTCTPTLTFTSTSADAALCAVRYEGPFTAGPLDTNPAVASDAASAWTSNTTATLAQADELVVTGIACANAKGPTVITASGYGAVTELNSTTGANSISAHMAAKVVAATTAVDAAWSGGIDPASVAIGIATFKKGTSDTLILLGQSTL